MSIAEAKITNQAIMGGWGLSWIPRPSHASLHARQQKGDKHKDPTFRQGPKPYLSYSVNTLKGAYRGLRRGVSWGLCRGMLGV